MNSIESVNQASKEQLGRFLLFAPSPMTDVAVRVLNRAYERFYTELGGWTPELSKQIGLDK